jgi:bifunctional enzyme CysN/CysC
MKNLTTVRHRVSAEDRARLNGHRGAILWFTGLSGAGKSTLAIELERALYDKACQCYVLDGDNLRQGLNSDLGFSPEDRVENIRRAGEVAGLFAEAGLVVISAFISPYRSDRERVRGAYGPYFSEIYINAPLSVCELRDPKGLYQRARKGELAEFTGVSAPYEAPQSPDLELLTGERSVGECVSALLDFALARIALRRS